MGKARSERWSAAVFCRRRDKAACRYWMEDSWVPMLLLLPAEVSRRLRRFGRVRNALHDRQRPRGLLCRARRRRGPGNSGTASGRGLLQGCSSRAGRSSQNMAAPTQVLPFGKRGLCCFRVQTRAPTILHAAAAATERAEGEQRDVATESASAAGNGSSTSGSSPSTNPVVGRSGPPSATSRVGTRTAERTPFSSKPLRRTSS
mmetsp:Transcript_14604/g.40181  ORF Transcript_14604/g.40181 Transcript_14604/m.40181 type:complete len:203 (-) Transcript_14604:1062-1670(-)